MVELLLLKVIGIDIKRNENEIENVIVNYVNKNKDKFFKTYGLDSTELKSILEERMKEIEEKLPEIESKNKKYNFWNRLLRIAGGLFFALLIMTFMLLFLFNITTSIPSIISIVLLAVTYIQTNNYSDKKNINKEKRYNKDLENINIILEEMENLEGKIVNNVIQNDSLKQVARKSSVRITDISSKVFDITRAFSLEAKKQTKNIYAKIKEDFREDDYSYNNQKDNNEETLVQKTIKQSEYYAEQRRNNELRIEKLENKLNIDKGRGNR